MSGRSNPFEGLEELFDRMSRQFESAARDWDVDWNAGRDRDHGGRLDLSIGEPTNGLDLAEDDEEFVVTVDVPGYESDDVDVRLSGDTLSVSGERTADVDEDAENYIRRERRSHSFDRRVQLPAPVDTDDVSARVTNGVLTITLGKREAGDSHTIEIE